MMWCRCGFKDLVLAIILISSTIECANVTALNNGQQTEQINDPFTEEDPKINQDNEDNIGTLIWPSERNLTSYCDIYRCNTNHIACGNTGKLGAQCPTDTTIVNMTNYKQVIVKMHNNRRNKIAGGFKHLRPAARMSEMIWDNELEMLAHLFVKTCDRKTTKCHHTKRFRQSGHNSGSFMYAGLADEMTYTDMIEGRVKAWFSGWTKITNRMLHKYQKGNKYPTTTVMLAERNTHVGCSASFFEQNEMYKFIFYCLYATTNVIDRPVYIASRTPGTRCKNMSRAYPNLCAVGEVYSDTDYKQYKGQKNEDDFYDDQGHESDSAEDDSEEQKTIASRLPSIENNDDINDDDVDDDDDDDSQSKLSDDQKAKVTKLANVPNMQRKGKL